MNYLLLSLLLPLFLSTNLNASLIPDIHIFDNQTISMNNSELNTSVEDSSSYESLRKNHIVEYYVFPFIFIIGTVCNFLTVLVMRRKKMRHQSTYFYMAVLAIADEMVLVVGCLNYWIYLVFGQNITIMSELSCKLACLLLYATLHFGVWIVVIMTIERFIAVALPLQANRLCTVKRAKMSTSILALIILAINFHFLFTHSLIKRNNERGCQTKSELFEFFMLKIWTWIDASIYSFIPLTLLVIFNILIVHNLIKASKNIGKLNSNANTKNKMNRHTNSSAEEINSDSNRDSVKKCQVKKFSARKKSISVYFFSFLSCLNLDTSSSNLNKAEKSKPKNKRQQIEPHSKYKLFKFKKIKQVAEKQEEESGSYQANSIYHENLLTPSINRLRYAPSVKSNNSGSKNQNTSGGSTQPSSANRRLTIMLLVVSMTFFLTSTPIVTLQTIEQAGLLPNSRALIIIRGIFLILQYLNHSINFFYTP